MVGAGSDVFQPVANRAAVATLTGCLLYARLVERFGELGLDQPFEDLRQLLIEPTLQYRPQQLAHEVFEGAGLQAHRKLIGAPLLALDRGELGKRRGRGSRGRLREDAISGWGRRLGGGRNRFDPPFLRAWRF